MKKILIAAALFLTAGVAFAAGTFTTYTTKSNDTLQSVAAAAGTTTQAIVALNPSIRLTSGQTLNVGYKAVTPPPVVIPPTTGEVLTTVYDTYYGWPDNTPHNSSILSTGGQASGDGTYANPLTAASGYIFVGGNPVLDYPYGTKLYVVNDRKYYVIGDECGDGPHPENEACHKDIDHPGVPQIDLWGGGVGSKYGTAAGKAAEDCEAQHTRVNKIIINPAPNYAVAPGTIYTTGCSAQYGDTVVTQ